MPTRPKGDPPSGQFPGTWELPAFEILELGPRRYADSLVIPVLNEGDRIRKQIGDLERLAAAVDVVIADGGSTDASLDPAFLRAHGVRAMLTKTGPGRLSAQLRMAYAWCLREHYRGIVTVDGNGKDGLDAIPRFLVGLQEGYAYVQGSRYVPGGSSSNTPLDRVFGGRLVHAPLISLAARHRFTDTTNGFRAYSAEYLLDERVAPFRDLFRDYALLFYLSVRASQLGYRVIEIPVERRYPGEGPPPTKISGISGRIRMMGELLAVVGGRYAPRTTA